MAQLSTIISSILRDMISAQHEANKYAMSLSEDYKKDKHMEKLALPTIALGEMDLNIHYGIKDIKENKQQHEINYSKLNDELQILCKHLTVSSVNTIIAYVKKTGIDNNPDSLNLIEKMHEMSEVKEKFSTFLSRKIYKSIQKNYAQILDKNGTIIRTEFLGIVNKIIDKELLLHQELTNLFMSEKGSIVLEGAQKELAKILEKTLPKKFSNDYLIHDQKIPTLDVIINSEELAKLPKDSIHTFQFKVTPNHLNMDVLDDNNLSTL